jgi:signal transduction histidine kinase
MLKDRNEALLASAVATPHDRRQAFVVMAVLVIAFIATVPIAKWPVPAFPQFIPIYDTAVLVLDILAGVLLYAQFEHVRRRSLLLLACAYVFTPFLVAAHALSVPNAFVPGSVIGGEQTAAWLWVAWHGGFPVFIIAYALTGRSGSRYVVPQRRVRRTGATALMATVALALTVVAVAAVGDGVMPTLMRGDVQSSAVTTLVLGGACVVHLVALAALVWHTRVRRVIDARLAVALVAMAIDVVLSSVLIESRYQLGFFLGRAYGLLGVLFVLGVLLRETVMLSAMAARLLDLERAARLQAESAGRAKDEFLAMLGHELRNPLAPIMTAVQLMRLRGVDAPELPIVL